MFTAPGLSWQACLKMCDQPLDLFTDPDMHLFIERGIHGGVLSSMHSHAKANNKYLGEEYDPSKPTSYIAYLDANNLYGWAMSQYLPYGSFEWVSPATFSTNFILNLADNAHIGYIF